MFPRSKKSQVEKSLKNHLPCSIHDQTVDRPSPVAAAESGKVAARVKMEDNEGMREGVKKRPARAADLVDGLCHRFDDHGTDAHEIRVILPQAVHALSAPRTKRGGGDGDKMTARARQELQRRDQPRLRE